MFTTGAEVPCSVAVYELFASPAGHVVFEVQLLPVIRIRHGACAGPLYPCFRRGKLVPANAGNGKDKQTLLKEIIGNLQAATNNCLELIKAVLNSEHELVGEDCHCRKSLELAVWTEQSRIDEGNKEKLQVLFE